MMNTLLLTKNLTVRIAQKTICERLTLSIQPGEIWGVLGQNGSGKTTLLHTLAGLIPATGDIILGDKNLLQLNKKVVAQQIGILFQDTPVFFPQTVFEFCLSGRFPHLNFFAWESHQDKQIVSQALLAMELQDKAAQKVDTLSGGERRRLAIATLLAQAPSLYLLDEPTNHLDLRQQMNVMRYFQHLVKERPSAVMMSLHEPRLAARYCTHVLLLFEANTLFGSTQQILTCDNLSRLYGYDILEALGTLQ